MTKKSFKEILSKEKLKLKEIKTWHYFVTGKDIAHKDKTKYSRKEKHKTGYDKTHASLFFVSLNF